MEYNYRREATLSKHPNYLGRGLGVFGGQHTEQVWPVRGAHKAKSLQGGQLGIVCWVCLQSQGG